MINKINLIIVAVAIAGCSTVEWKDGCGAVSLTGFFIDVSAGEIEVTKSSKCDVTLTIREGMSDQTKALGEVAEGVARGLN